MNDSILLDLVHILLPHPAAAAAAAVAVIVMHRIVRQDDDAVDRAVDHTADPVRVRDQDLVTADIDADNILTIRRKRMLILFN